MCEKIMQLSSIEHTEKEQLKEEVQLSEPRTRISRETGGKQDRRVWKAGSSFLCEAYWISQ